MRRIYPHARKLSPRRLARRGFTLLETGMSLVIISVGIVAMIEAQQGFIVSNSWSSHAATASYLASEIRERIRNLPRHDPVSGLLIVNGVLTGLGREAGEVTVEDLDDIDDYMNLSLGATGNFDGPIDAFGRVIAEIDGSGNIRIDPNTGEPMPLMGWTQQVTVEKVNPYNYSQTVSWPTAEQPVGTFPGRALDRYPLRVTVRVLFQSPFEGNPREVVRMSWIVPDDQ
jgi:hypothetical protein